MRCLRTDVRIECRRSSSCNGVVNSLFTESEQSQTRAMGEMMQKTFLVLSVAGPHRDLSKDAREQPFWDEHAAYIDTLVDDGFIMMGGPLADEGGALLIVKADDENEVRERTMDDPWYMNGILKQESIKRWEIFIDERK
jgi:uncharacterized protein YciI